MPTTNGDLLIKTTIIRDRAYGLTTLPPDEIIKQKKIARVTEGKSFNR